MEKSLGLNCNEHGLLSRRVMGRSAYMFDWMHVYVVHGVFHMEVNELLPKLARCRMTSELIHDWIEDLQFPSENGWQQWDVLSLFTKGLTKGGFKEAASQCLCVYPLLRCMLQHSPDVKQALVPEMQTFSALCDVLDYLSAGNRGAHIKPDVLQTLIMKHCNFFLKAHGEEPVIHKFHMAMHLPMNLLKFGHLISCFTHERQHKHVKRIADALRTSQKGFALSVATDVWDHQMQDLRCLSP